MPQDNIQIKEVQFANAQLLPEIVKLLEEGHTVTLRLRGNSMRPFLKDNRDRALLIKATHPQKGAPVLAEISPGHYVLHRIINIDNQNVTLRGDGNLANEYCTINDIKASVVGFYRKGRRTLDHVDGWKWNLYSFIWVRLYPIRRYLLAIDRRISQIIKK